MSLLYHVNMYLEFLILACTIYILAPENMKLTLEQAMDALGIQGDERTMIAERLQDQ